MIPTTSNCIFIFLKCFPELIRCFYAAKVEAFGKDEQEICSNYTGQMVHA